MSERPYAGLDAFTHPRDHSSRVVPLWVNGSPPYELTVSEHTVAFGNRLVASPSAPYNLLIKNTGFQPLNILSVTSDSDMFTIPVIPVQVLEAGQTLTVAIVFRPEEYGVYSGSIHIVADHGIAKTIRLVGAGVWDYVQQVDIAIEALFEFLVRATKPAITTNGPLLNLVNTAAEFVTELPVGTPSATIDFPISNAGNQALTVGNFAVTGDFAIVSGVAQSISPFGSMVVVLRFTPTEPGTREGMLTFTSNTVSSPHSVKLVGYGKDSGTVPDNPKTLRDSTNTELLDSNSSPLESY